MFRVSGILISLFLLFRNCDIAIVFLEFYTVIIVLVVLSHVVVGGSEGLSIGIRWER